MNFSTPGSPPAPEPSNRAKSLLEMIAGGDFSRPDIQLICTSAQQPVEYRGTAYGKDVFFRAIGSHYVFCAAGTLPIAICCVQSVLRDPTLAQTMSREFEAFLIVGNPQEAGLMSQRLAHAILAHACARLEESIADEKRRRKARGNN